MSWTTGTQVETLAVNSAVQGTTYNTFLGPQYVGTVTGAGYLPLGFFPPSQSVGKSFLIKAHGILGTTGTPNLTLGVSLNTTQGTYNGSGVLATTGAVAQAATVTNIPWDLEVIATCSGYGSSGTVLADGIVRVYTASTTIQSMRCSSSAANPNTALTVSTEAAYYVELFATWSASAAANLINAYSILVLGLN